MTMTGERGAAEARPPEERRAFPDVDTDWASGRGPTTGTREGVARATEEGRNESSQRLMASTQTRKPTTRWISMAGRRSVGSDAKRDATHAAAGSTGRPWPPPGVTRRPRGPWSASHTLRRGMFASRRAALIDPSAGPQLAVGRVWQVPRLHQRRGDLPRSARGDPVPNPTTRTARRVVNVGFAGIYPAGVAGLEPATPVLGTSRGRPTRSSSALSSGRRFAQGHVRSALRDSGDVRAVPELDFALRADRVSTEPVGVGYDMRGGIDTVTAPTVPTVQLVVCSSELTST